MISIISRSRSVQRWLSPFLRWLGFGGSEQHQIIYDELCPPTGDDIDDYIDAWRMNLKTSVKTIVGRRDICALHEYANWNTVATDLKIIYGKVRGEKQWDMGPTELAIIFGGRRPWMIGS